MNNSNIFISKYGSGLIYLRLNLSTGKYVKVLKFKTPKIDGWYFKNSEKLVFIYKNIDNLCLFVNGSIYNLGDIDRSTRVVSGDSVTFKIFIGDKKIYDIQYKVIEPSWPDYDLYLCDFHLMLFDVINNPGDWKNMFKEGPESVTNSDRLA